MLIIKKVMPLSLALCAGVLLTVGCSSHERDNPLDSGCTTCEEVIVSFDWGYDTEEDLTFIGETTWSVKINAGVALGVLGEFPTAIERDGYILNGWFDENGIQYFATTPIDSSVALTAKWSIKRYVITYNATGGSVTPETDTTNNDWKLDTLPTPTLTGNVFVGWFTAETEGSAVDTSTVFKSDTTVFARWSTETYAVTFDANGGEVTPATGITGDGWKLTAPLPTPTRTGYDFAGWFTEKTGGDSVTTATTYDSNDTIYARWDIKEYTVGFVTGTDESIEPVKTDINKQYKITLPVKPERAGYNFAGWFDNNDVEYTNTTTITGDVTLTAKWAIKTYQISFNFNYPNATTPEVKTTGDGWKLTDLPTAPNRLGYTFAGWFTAETGGNEVTAATAFNGDATVFAQWTMDIYTVTFVTGTDETIEPVQTNVDNEFKISVPTKQLTKSFDPRAAGVPEGLYRSGGNYTFDGWYLDNVKFNFDNDEITENTTLTAKWVIPSTSVIDVSEEVGDDLITKANTYISNSGSSVDVYILVLASEVTINSQLTNERSLTIIGGSGSKIIGGDNFRLMESKYTFENVNITKLSVAADKFVTLSGFSTVDTLTLRANAIANAHIVIAEDWAGSVGKLDLYTDGNSVTENYWLNKTIIQSIPGNMLSQNDIDRIILGQFTSNNDRYSISLPPGNSKISDSGILVKIETY